MKASYSAVVSLFILKALNNKLSDDLYRLCNVVNTLVVKIFRFKYLLTQQVKKECRSGRGCKHL